MFDKTGLPDKTLDKFYDDGLRPAVSESGKLLGRVPRAINAALSGIDQWIAKKEYNVEATKKTLALKLESIDSVKIVPPEPYVAVPIIQALSYCMSNEELYNLYANLLAKAMVTDTKESVHPAFVEIIKQMSPNDALTIKEFSKHNGGVPAATFSIVMKHQGIHLIGSAPEEKMCSAFVVDIQCRELSEEQIRVSIDNLRRLGLISLEDFILSGENTYNFAKQSELYSIVSETFKTEPLADFIKTIKKCFAITSLGELFCSICIDGF